MAAWLLATDLKAVEPQDWKRDCIEVDRIKSRAPLSQIDKVKIERFGSPMRESITAGSGTRLRQLAYHSTANHTACASHSAD